MLSANDSPETLADRRRVEEGYALVNAMWKTQGAMVTLRYVHHVPYARALQLGLDLSEVDRVIASMDSFYRGGYRDWPTQWFRTGDEYLDKARKARAQDHKQTMAQFLLSAATCYHLAGGGSNIYPREVEEVLLRHTGVTEVSVIGRPDPEWGEIVVAYVVGDAKAVELDALCLASIARFKRPKIISSSIAYRRTTTARF